MPEPNEVKPSPAANAAPVKAAPMFHIEAGDVRELMFKVSQALQRTKQFVVRKTDPKEGTPSFYALFSLDDTGKNGAYRPSLTLTPEESKKLPFEEGCPVVASFEICLRQLTVPAAVTAKINDRLVQTATREANSAARVGNDALLAEVNKRLIAQGKEPLTSL